MLLAQCTVSWGSFSMGTPRISHIAFMPISTIASESTGPPFTAHVTKSFSHNFFLVWAQVPRSTPGLHGQFGPSSMHPPL